MISQGYQSGPIGQSGPVGWGGSSGQGGPVGLAGPVGQGGPRDPGIKVFQVDQVVKVIQVDQVSSWSAFMICIQKVCGLHILNNQVIEKTTMTTETAI